MPRAAGLINIRINKARSFISWLIGRIGELFCLDRPLVVIEDEPKPMVMFCWPQNRTEVGVQSNVPVISLRHPKVPPSLLARLVSSGIAADLLTILLVLYTAYVLTPVFQIADFTDLELSAEITASSESNPVNQFFWFAGTFLGFLAVLPDWRTRLGRLILANPWLFGLVAMGLVSSLWALEPSIALRRSIQQAMVVFCVAAAVAGSHSLDRVLRLLYLGFCIAMLVHLVAVPLPNSYNHLGEFRGFFADKNGLGGLAAVAILYGGAIRPTLRSRRAKSFNLFYFLGWGAILVLSISKTSMALVVCIPAIYLGLQLLGRMTRVGIGPYFILVPIAAGSLLAFLVFGMGIAPSAIVGLISPDVTFTGRTSIWMFILSALNGHWLLGFGFHSFWSIGPLAPNLAAEEHFIRLLNQAHNGYLDLVLSVGLAGLALFFCVLAQAAATTTRIRTTWPVVHALSWMLIIFALIHNMSESSLFRGFSPPWLFLLFAIFIPARAWHEMPEH